MGDIVRVPFPFVERPRLRPRPVLLVSLPLPQTNVVGWALMITSAENGGWPDDISLTERYAEFGLPVPSIIRTAKVATVRLNDAPLIGRVSAGVLEEVKSKLRRLLQI